VLADPVRPSSLFNVLISVLSSSGKTKKTRQEDGEELTTRQTPESLTGHLLVAEDNRINQLYIVELLKLLGCTCDVVVNGEEVLSAVAQTQYDLILMDCQMPEMDGFVATQEIRKREASSKLSGHLPIIALTANALKGDREHCLEVGMDDYLSKPLEVGALRTVLSKHLQ
jgi:CheY-like chemotaxis protein